MSMLNNKDIKVTFQLKELIQIVYKTLANRNLVPYTMKHKPVGYGSKYDIFNGEGKIIEDINDISVTFSLTKLDVEEEGETAYTPGDWIGEDS